MLATRSGCLAALLLSALPAAAQSRARGGGFSPISAGAVGRDGGTGGAWTPAGPLLRRGGGSAAVRRVSLELGLQRVAVGEDTLAFQLAPGLQEGTRLRLPCATRTVSHRSIVNLVLVVDSRARRARSRCPAPRGGSRL